MIIPGSQLPEQSHSERSRQVRSDQNFYPSHYSSQLPVLVPERALLFFMWPLNTQFLERNLTVSERKVTLGSHMLEFKQKDDV